MNDFLASLRIDHVSQHIDFAGDPAILFQANGYGYTLLTRMDKHRPLVVHHTIKRKKLCPLCIDNGPVCKILSRYKLELFYHLITYNSVRLHWLFLDHDRSSDKKES